jgi:hypothetical protein
LEEEYRGLRYAEGPAELKEFLSSKCVEADTRGFIIGWIFAQEQFYGKKIKDIPEDAGVERGGKKYGSID